MNANFGDLLKDWRSKRRMSQLDLSHQADVSARHIAFLEKGRSKPSPSMVVQLAEALAIPRAERNVLLHAAGYAPVYRQRDIGDPDLDGVRQAMEWTLNRHDPYPGFTIDRHWSIVMTNQSAAGLLGALGMKVGDSLLDTILHSEMLRLAIVNWDEVARYMLARLRTESLHYGGDPVLNRAIEKLSEEVGPETPEGELFLQPVVPTQLRAGDQVLSLISTIAQFGTAEDITLANLRIELMFPADEKTKDLLNSQFN